MGKRRLLVKHKDSKRDDFCNDFNFGFFLVKRYLKVEEFFVFIGRKKWGFRIFSGRVFFNLRLRKWYHFYFLLCFLVIVNSKFTLEL